MRSQPIVDAPIAPKESRRRACRPSRRGGWVILGLIACFGAATAAQAEVSTCAQTESRLGAEVRIARAALTRIHVGDMDEVVTPEASAAIERLKDRIVAFVTGTMACIAPNARTRNVQRILASLGDAYRDGAHYTPDNYPNLHGNGLAYEVQRPAGQPALLVVVARVAIECGEDGMLMLFARTPAGWHLLILRRAPPYRGIEGAYGDLRYAVSPPDPHGRWYLAFGWIPTWCTSNWRALHLDLSRPGPSPTGPRIFFRRDLGTYLGNDNGGSFRAAANRFQVRHQGSIANADILLRPHVETYAVLGDRVARIQPAAFGARDFADEWVASDWSEAASWSGPEPAIREAHRQLHPPGSNGSSPLGPAHRCAGGLLQVRFGAGKATWYLFVGGRGPFRLVRASRTSMRSCRGPDQNGDVLYP